MKNYNITILYQDDDILVVSKPNGLHSAKGKEGDSVQTWVEDQKLVDITLPDSGLLHRLDKESSGLLVLARQIRSYTFLKNVQLQDGFKKEYQVLVSPCVHPSPLGSVPPRSRPIFPAFLANTKMLGFEEWDTSLQLCKTQTIIGVLNAGKACIQSDFKPYGKAGFRVACLAGSSRTTQVLKAYMHKNNPSVVCIEVGLTRGYRHQVRAHLAWIGLPILGDTLYNTENSKSRLCLHSSRISFIHPQKLIPFSIQDKTIFGCKQTVQTDKN